MDHCKLKHTLNEKVKFLNTSYPNGESHRERNLAYLQSVTGILNAREGRECDDRMITLFERNLNLRCTRQHVVA